MLKNKKGVKSGPSTYIHFLNAEKVSLYIEIDTGEAFWTLPPNTQLRESLLFVTHKTVDGRKVYFEDLKTGETMWELPTHLGRAVTDSRRVYETLDVAESEELIGHYSEKKASIQEKDLQKFLDELAKEALEKEIKLKTPSPSSQKKSSRGAKSSPSKLNGGKGKKKSKPAKIPPKDPYIHIFNIEDVPIYVHCRTGVADWIIPEGVDIKRSLVCMSHLEEDGARYYEILADHSTHWELPAELLGMGKKACNLCLQLEDLGVEDCERVLRQPYNEAESIDMEQEMLEVLAHYDVESEGDNGEEDDDEDDNDLDEQDANSEDSSVLDQEDAEDPFLIDRNQYFASASSVGDSPGESSSKSPSSSLAGASGNKRKPIVRSIFDEYSHHAEHITAHNVQRILYDFGQLLSTEEAEKLVKDHSSHAQDTDSGGKNVLTYEDFMVLWRNHPLLRTLKPSDAKIQDLHAACKLFGRFDHGHKGFVTISSFEKIFDRLLAAKMIKSSKEDMAASIKWLDDENTGLVPYTLYLAWFEEARKFPSTASSIGLFFKSLNILGTSTLFNSQVDASEPIGKIERLAITNGDNEDDNDDDEGHDNDSKSKSKGHRGGGYDHDEEEDDWGGGSMSVAMSSKSIKGNKKAGISTSSIRGDNDGSNSSSSKKSHSSNSSGSGSGKSSFAQQSSTMKKKSSNPSSSSSSSSSSAFATPSTSSSSSNPNMDDGDDDDDNVGFQVKSDGVKKKKALKGAVHAVMASQALQKGAQKRSKM